jgi:PilZ domain
VNTSFLYDAFVSKVDTKRLLSTNRTDFPTLSKIQKKMDLRAELCDIVTLNCISSDIFWNETEIERRRLPVTMEELKRRKFERSRSLNLVDYVIIGEDGRRLSRSMGRTRNVGEGGLLLETHRPLIEGQTVLITLGLKDDTAQLEGTIIHREPPASCSDETKYCAGVKFTGMSKRDRETLKKYIQALKASNGK